MVFKTLRCKYKLKRYMHDSAAMSWTNRCKRSWKVSNIFDHLHVEELICKHHCKNSILKTSK